MRFPTQKQKPRKSTLASFPVPTAGLISNRNLALPDGQAPGAAILNNWFPTPQSIILRRGMARRASLPNDETVKSMMTYVYGEQNQLFAATDSGIFDITNVNEAYSRVIGTQDGDYLSPDGVDHAFGWYSVDPGDVAYASTNGDWVSVQFSTAGGTYLIGVNGIDEGFIYDGNDFWPYVPGGITQFPVTITNDFVAGETVLGPPQEVLTLVEILAVFSVGETVTGGTSAATGKVARFSGGKLTLSEVTGTFVDGETVTGATSSAAGEIDGDPVPTNATATVVKQGAGFLFMRDIEGAFFLGDTLTGSIGGDATLDGNTLLIAPGPSTDSSRFSYVWTYKTRIWFSERDTLNAWYLPVDQVGGTCTEFPMGGVFNRGGALLWGQTWSLPSGGDGGLSEQNIFCTTQGEIVSYQGISPDQASSWDKVGLYRVGVPLGKKAFIRAGGDLVVATTVGFIPLSKAIGTDYAAIGLIAISNPVADEWRRAVDERSSTGWVCELWAEGSMTVIATPTPNDLAPLVLVVNADSGAWTRFTGWQPTSLTTYRGRLFMGSILGRVQEGWVGGSDEGLPYTADMIPLFNDLGGPGQRKIAKYGRAILRSSYPVRERLVARFDWNMTLPAAPDAVTVSVGNEWDNGIWNESIWNAERASIIAERWVSLGGSGYAASASLQITSGSAVPLDAELVRLDYTYDMGDIVT